MTEHTHIPVIVQEQKRKRQQEAADKSRAAAEIASKKMAEMQEVGGCLPGCLPSQVRDVVALL